MDDRWRSAKTDYEFGIILRDFLADILRGRFAVVARHARGRSENLRC
jgi:hypothetical protein